MAKKTTRNIIIAVSVVVLIIIIAAFGSVLVDSIGAIFGINGDDGGGGNETEGDTNEPPVAIVTSDRSTAYEGEAIFFDGNESHDPDYQGNLSNRGIVIYKWDFGDGTEPETDVNGTMEHVFSDQGQYNVTLTVVDELGAEGSASVSVKIVPRDLVINPNNQILIGESIFIFVPNNSSKINWTIEENAKHLDLNFNVTGYDFRDIEESTVNFYLYNPWETILRNETVTVMGSESFSWEVTEQEISWPGQYYVLMKCTKGAAYIGLSGKVTYM